MADDGKLRRFVVVCPSEGGMATINNVWIIEAASPAEAKNMAAGSEWGTANGTPRLYAEEIDTLPAMWKWFR